MSVLAAARNRVRKLLLAKENAGDPRLAVWPTANKTSDPNAYHRVCNVCGWHGPDFAGPPHSEMANCPNCGSIARDRFLFWCWTHRVPYSSAQRVLETSPRLDHRYRDRMGRIVDYTASDYDESAHKAMIKLDLQKMDLPDSSVDVVLTPHVLEHVPDTTLALAELFRVVAPQGSVLLMIPMPQGTTAPPTEPEYHGDNTLVFWRFGWDLRGQLESAGFDVTCLVTQPLIDRIRRKEFDTGWTGPDIDEVSLLSQADPDMLTAIADEREARRYGFEPDLHFITWHCVKPGG
jgi:SAM-dependent methyltransferase